MGGWRRLSQRVGATHHESKPLRTRSPAGATHRAATDIGMQNNVGTRRGQRHVITRLWNCELGVPGQSIWPLVHPSSPVVYGRVQLLLPVRWCHSPPGAAAVPCRDEPERSPPCSGCSEAGWGSTRTNADTNSLDKQTTDEDIQMPVKLSQNSLLRK